MRVRGFLKIKNLNLNSALTKTRKFFQVQGRRKFYPQKYSLAHS